MYKMNDAELQLLKSEYASLNDAVLIYEDDLKEYRSGKNHDIGLDDIHLIEEQLFYMRGYLRLVKIRLFSQGVKV